MPATETLRALLAADSGPAAHRQAGVVGTDGPGATFTGESCQP